MTSVRRHTGCSAVGLAAVDPPGASRVLLTPFDRIDPLPERRRWRRSPWAAVVRAMAGAALDSTGLACSPAAIARTPLQVLAWQLEPALALRDGRAARVLVADEVGLGKTVQAGWAIAMLAAAGGGRALVLTPGGLRDQWQAELDRLFGLRATVLDAVRLRLLRRGLPVSINPWALPGVFIAALDYAKQPEVLAALLERRWSLVVFDEAHNLAARTDRRRAADLVARGADHVLLLTATPHQGDRAAYEQLCRIGAPGTDPLAVFRRSRADVSIAVRRRTRTLLVRQTAAERRLHAAIRRYTRRIRRESPDRASAELIRWVLLKRAASCSHALLRTLGRRRDALRGAPAVPSQAPLPFGGEGEHDEEDDRMPEAIDAPALPDRQSELELLDTLVARTHEASRIESKLTAVARLLRRAAQPAIVFTEFRDTLQRLAWRLRGLPVACLHGGMTRAERRDAVLAFTEGSARVLLATDAAGEGLNLHRTCRLVINIDVPWNPTRLEQRAGRVDRIGQARAVHAVTLAGRGSADAALLRRLRRRQDRIRQDLEPPSGSPRPAPADRRVDRLAVASAVVRGVAALTARSAMRPAGSARAGAIPFTRVSPRVRRRLHLPAGVLLLFRALVDVPAGPAVAAAVPVMVPCDPALRPMALRRLLRACEAAARVAAADRAHAALEDGLRAHRARAELQRQRLAASLAELAPAPPLWQDGLFDRRAMTRALRSRLGEQQRRGELQAALDAATAAASADAGSCRLDTVAALVLR